MWSKSNADKLKMELSGKREKQLQSIKNEKTTEDIVNVKMDSGFLSDANLSCDTISKENIEYGHKSHENPKETTKTTLDSGLDIDEPSCLSGLNVDQKENHCSKNEHNYNIYFQQNEDGETYVPSCIFYVL